MPRTLFIGREQEKQLYHTFLPFACSANGSFVWPLLQNSLAAFAPKRGEFF